MVITFSGDYFTKSKVDNLNKICTKDVLLLNLNDDECFNIFSMNNKKELGQFYSTNSENILKGLTLPTGFKVIEPFAGQGDLIEFCKQFGPVELYDIDPKIPDIIVQDTIANPPNYDNSYCITNPPYLARNHAKSKELFDLYEQNDLYKCFLITLINSNCIGGCLIIPLNFWCGARQSDIELRGKFMNKFVILKLNIFESAAFDDTAYSVCSFSFIVRTQTADTQNLSVAFYPSGYETNFTINSPRWLIGDEVLNTYTSSKIVIKRLVLDKSIPSGQTASYLKLFAMDSVGPDSPKFLEGCIKMKVVDEYTFGKNTDRTFACFSWNLMLTIDDQKNIAKMFNNFLLVKRKKYNSLFLSNYRENQRKRISFELATNLLNSSIVHYCKYKNINIDDIIIK